MNLKRQASNSALRETEASTLDETLCTLDIRRFFRGSTLVGRDQKCRDTVSQLPGCVEASSTTDKQEDATLGKAQSTRAQAVADQPNTRTWLRQQSHFA